MIKYLVIDGERAKTEDVLHVLDLSEEKAEELIEKGKNKGFFEYKGMVCSFPGRISTTPTGRRKSPKMKVEEKKKFKNLYPEKTYLIHYFLGVKRVSLSDLENEIGASRDTIRYNLRDIDSIILNGVRVTTKRLVVEKYATTDSLTGDIKEYENMKDICADLVVTKGTINNYISQSKKYRGHLTITRTYKELK